jgi:hypothetical protein
MKANLFHLAVLYAMEGLISSLWGQKPSRVDLDRLSPSQLVKFVTYRNRAEDFDGTLNCVATGPAKRDQEAIERLVSLGERSVPALEEEFRAISKKGDNAQYSPNTELLLSAYARIRSARAFPLLRDMDLSQHFRFATASLDGAIAVALSLTSYLSIAHLSARVFACQGQQPGDALDQMIVAWERGDRLWFETSVGEAATRAIAVKDDEWQAFRRTFWRDAPDAAIGYKFQVPGNLSEPSMRTPIQARVPNGEEKFDVDTAFYDRNGRNCGHMMIEFIQSATPKPPGYLRYAVDNSNIADVLQLISACARQ